MAYSVLHSLRSIALLNVRVNKPSTTSGLNEDHESEDYISFDLCIYSKSISCIYGLRSEANGSCNFNFKSP